MKWLIGILLQRLAGFLVDWASGDEVELVRVDVLPGHLQHHLRSHLGDGLAELVQMVGLPAETLRRHQLLGQRSQSVIFEGQASQQVTLGVRHLLRRGCFLSQAVDLLAELLLHPCQVSRIGADIAGEHPGNPVR